MFESEKRRVAERLKDFIKSRTYVSGTFIMLRNGHILNISDYLDVIKAGKVNPQDAYVYIVVELMALEIVFYYPFLQWYGFLLRVFLSKLGFYNSENNIVPATGLRYVVFIEGYRDYLSVEVADLDTVVNNTNLRKIVFEVMGGKIIGGENKITEEEYRKILGIYRSQKLFTGYNIDEVWDILYNYYHEDNQSRIKELARITFDYERIFQPYRVCYDKKTWKEVDCLSIN